MTPSASRPRTCPPSIRTTSALAADDCADAAQTIAAAVSRTAKKYLKFLCTRAVRATMENAQAAFSNSCTLGQGSGAKFLNGAVSASVMRSKIAVLTDGRARTRAHQSATAG